MSALTHCYDIDYKLGADGTHTIVDSQSTPQDLYVSCYFASQYQRYEANGMIMRDVKEVKTLIQIHVVLQKQGIRVSTNLASHLRRHHAFPTVTPSS